MAGSTVGKLFTLTTFGESHGVAIGGIVDGFPANVAINIDLIQMELDRRKPGQSKLVTQRKESDEVQFLSGIFEGKSTGSPIGFLIPNTDSKSKDYDHVFILSLSAALSGTYSTFQHGITEVGMENYSLIDTMTLCGPVQESVKVIRKMNAEGIEPKEIEDYLNNDFFKNTESYIYPLTLEQLKRSGRMSKSAALLASMMKIKPLLKIENQGNSIDKFKTTRTEQKILDEIIKDLKLHSKILKK